MREGVRARWREGAWESLPACSFGYSNGALGRPKLRKEAAHWSEAGALRRPSWEKGA